MTRGTDDDGSSNPRKSRPPHHEPARPRGSGKPHGNDRGSGSQHPLAVARHAADEHTKEILELAGVMAEEVVQPFLASSGQRQFAGRCFVSVRFLDLPTLESFKRTRSIHAIELRHGWHLVRRWAEAGGDGALDEAMCAVVAHRLNKEFEGLLMAQIITWLR